MNDTVLKVETVVSKLLTTDEKLKAILSEKLRFRPKNYTHNAAYRKKQWDGWKYFFDAKSGAFLTGLVPEVKAALRILKKDYALVDQREAPQWAVTKIGDDFLNSSLPDGFDPIKLHDYQPDLVNQAINYGRGIIVAPTAAGKTFCLISLLRCLPPKTPTLFLTKFKGLVHQNWQEMKLWGVPHLGRWYANFKEPNYVVCATAHVDTLSSLEKLLPKFKVLVVDEVHDCMSAVPLRAYKKMKNANIRVGISATPFKWNKKKIDDCHKWLVKGHFGPIFKTSTTESGVLTTKDLQERQILSSDECFFYVVDRPDITHEPFGDAVKLGIEQNFHFHEMVSRLAKSCPGRTLVVVERIEQGHYLKQLIPGSVFVYGDVALKDRDPVIAALKKGDKSVAIIMRQIITAGIDIKIHDLINASGGDAAHNTTQLLGRGLRRATDKDKLRFHDFLFKINPYLQDHSEWRMEVLRKDGHSVTVKETIDA